MTEQKPTKTCFEKVTRSTALRAICDLADSDNEPIGQNGCWLTKMAEQNCTLTVKLFGKFVIFINCASNAVLATQIRLHIVSPVGSGFWIYSFDVRESQGSESYLWQSSLPPSRLSRIQEKQHFTNSVSQVRVCQGLRT